MPFTDEERALIESLVVKCLDLQQNFNNLVDKVNKNTNWTLKHEYPRTILDLSEDEIKEKIRSAVNAILRGTPVKNHTHLNDQEGGPAFAKKGATLID